MTNRTVCPSSASIHASPRSASDTSNITTTTAIPAEQINTPINGKYIRTTPQLARQRWHRERFEDFYQYSGDGDSNNGVQSSESYSLVIVTETIASILPTVTRVKLMPSSPQIYDLSTAEAILESSSSQFVEATLARSSFIFPGEIKKRN